MARMNIIAADRIEKAIRSIRGQKVLLDQDLAELYGVATGQLVRHVKRNRDRCPSDFVCPEHNLFRWGLTPLQTNS